MFRFGVAGSKIKTVTDHWKFTKNIFSKNPNWHLAEIISK